MIMMNFLRDLMAATASFSSYNRFLMGGRKKAVRYVILLTLLVTSLLGLRTALLWTSSKEVMSRRIENDVPVFALTKEGLVVKEGRPVIVDFENIVVVFDQNRQLDPQVMTPYRAGLYLSGDHLLLWADNRMSRTVWYKNLPFLYVDRQRLFTLVDGMIPLGLVLFLLALVLRIMMKLFGVWMASFITMAIVRAKGRKFSFAQCFTLSAYAITVPTLIDTFLDGMPMGIQSISPLLYYGVFGFYVIGALDGENHESFVNNGEKG